MTVADKLALLANTKENLRLSLRLGKDVPFSQYASHIPFYAKAGTVFDFVNNQYSKYQFPVSLSDISEFIRLSSATEWQDEQFVEVANNLPRISGEGLLVEEQRTNILSRSAGGFSVTNGSAAAEPTYVGLPWRSVVANAGSSFHGFTQSAAGFPLSTTLTLSVFIRRGARRYIYVRMSGALRDAGVVVDFELGEVIGTSSGIISYNLKRLASDTFQLSYTSVSHPDRDTGAIYLFFSDTGSFSAGSNPIYVGDGKVCGYAGPVQVEEGPFPTSYIPTEGTPATRSPETLNIPLLPTQTITGDWDNGVTYSVDGGIATFTGHGYIRNISVEDL